MTILCEHISRVYYVRRCCNPCANMSVEHYCHLIAPGQILVVANVGILLMASLKGEGTKSKSKVKVKVKVKVHCTASIKIQSIVELRMREHIYNNANLSGLCLLTCKVYQVVQTFRISSVFVVKYVKKHEQMEARSEEDYASLVTVCDVHESFWKIAIIDRNGDALLDQDTCTVLHVDLPIRLCVAKLTCYGE